ncbi:class I SAM-dependent methyltransferase [Suttonella sp. R2A3]|uniref:class I SAM-dependent methyltransferase n=1 Tax=Suttonella sp. R2A3 TaxID=2908648 RepID=UPI001F433B15|nr:class I SAM-dependent methyltransferase [Suttonella sp. R2A3]UJF25144.1 class I SAM-dependent methyltransferase [Suttonella sp. R2A3]
MKPSDDAVKAGQAVYTPRVLSIYDIVVLGISNNYIWKCPSPRIEALYDANISNNHLEVGVGTGYFPDRCTFPSDKPRIALMDLNPNTLDFASNRLVRYEPETYVQNVLESIDYDIEPFDSIGINYLFHCVPGAITNKMVILDHLQKLMKPGCKVFGSTILQGGVTRNWAARRLMKIYNKKGIFTNENDDLQGLQNSLSQRLNNVHIQVIGCVALFSGSSL